MDIGFPHTVLKLNKAQRFDLFHDVMGHLGEGKKVYASHLNHWVN